MKINMLICLFLSFVFCVGAIVGKFSMRNFLPAVHFYNMETADIVEVKKPYNGLPLEKADIRPPVVRKYREIVNDGVYWSDGVIVVIEGHEYLKSIYNFNSSSNIVEHYTHIGNCNGCWNRMESLIDYKISQRK